MGRHAVQERNDRHGEVVKKRWTSEKMSREVTRKELGVTSGPRKENRESWWLNGVFQEIN